MPPPLHPLWLTFLQSRAPALRSDLAVLHQNLVDQVVYAAFGRRIRRGHDDGDEYAVTLNDLRSAGKCGLLKGIDQYDPGRGAKPETWLKRKISSAVLDELRDLDHLGRKDRKAEKRIRAAIERLERAGEGAATAEEVAAEAGVPVEQVRSVGLGERIAGATPASAYKRSEEGEDEDGERNPLDARSHTDTPAERLKRLEAVEERMRQAFWNKPPKQVRALLLYHVEGLSYREVYRVLKQKRTTPDGAPPWVRRVASSLRFLVGE